MGFSQSRDRTWVSCIAGRFLYPTELHVGFNGYFITALPLKHSFTKLNLNLIKLLSRKGEEQVKQCNQLNPKYETSNRTSDQFLQQIGEKRDREDLEEKEKRRKEKRRGTSYET